MTGESMAEERVPLADAPTPFVDPRDPTVRGVALTPPMVAWLAAALAGACVLVAWPVLAQLYWIERGRVAVHDVAVEETAGPLDPVELGEHRPRDQHARHRQRSGEPRDHRRSKSDPPNGRITGIDEGSGCVGQWDTFLC